MMSRILLLLPTVFVFIIVSSNLDCSEAKHEHHNYIHQQARILRQRLLQVLGRYEIGESVISYSGTVITLKFPLSDQVPDGSVSTTTYSDGDCSVNINGNNFLVPSILYDDNPNPDGTKNREVTVRYDIDANEIQKSDVWVQDASNQFFINFCMSIELHSGDANTTGVSQTLETVVRLKVDFLGGFATENEIAPKDPTLESFMQKYFVVGYLCDDNREQMIFRVPLAQGSKVRVCVEPTEEALQDGVFMRRIDSFTYQREKLPAEPGQFVTQVAVRDGASADPATTELFCERGWELCYFDTLLKGDFYFSTGPVFGYGEAWLQYGKGSIRKLRFVVYNGIQQQRVLQDVDGGFAGAAQFRVNFMVSSEKDFKFGAIAYECDSHNRKVENKKPKRLGASIRVCVTPNKESSAFDMRLNRIDSWNWTRQEVNASQPSVEPGGKQASNGLTILTCVPGATLCVFRTQFIDDFFVSDGTINGLADVVMQFGIIQSDEVSVARRRTLSSIHSTHRQMQDAEIDPNEALIVGTVPAKLDTPVANSINDLPEHCKYNQNLAEWWEQESQKEKVMNVSLVAAIIGAIIASLCCCWCFPCLAKRSDEEEIIEKDKAGNLKVNVDLKQKTEETMINKSVSSKNLLLACDDTLESESSKEQRPRSSRKLDLVVPDGCDDSQPKAQDICFDDKSQPGTKKLIKSIQQYQKSFPNESFGPHAYRLIKKDMGNARYFKTNKNGRLVESSTKESVELIGELFEQVKMGKLPKSSSTRSLRDLEDNAEPSQSKGSKRSLLSGKGGSSRRLLEDEKDIQAGNKNKSPVKRSATLGQRSSSCNRLEDLATKSKEGGGDRSPRVQAKGSLESGKRSSSCNRLEDLATKSKDTGGDRYKETRVKSKGSLESGRRSSSCNRLEDLATNSKDTRGDWSRETRVKSKGSLESGKRSSSCNRLEDLATKSKDTGGERSFETRVKFKGSLESGKRSSSCNRLEDLAKNSKDTGGDRSRETRVKSKGSLESGKRSNSCNRLEDLATKSKDTEGDRSRETRAKCKGSLESGKRSNSCNRLEDLATKSKEGGGDRSREARVKSKGSLENGKRSSSSKSLRDDATDKKGSKSDQMKDKGRDAKDAQNRNENRHSSRRLEVTETTTMKRSSSKNSLR